MAVRLRMKRMGRKNRPYYRIGAFDAHEERDGKVIENLGTYDPLEPKNEKQVTLKKRAGGILVECWCKTDGISCCSIEKVWYCF